MKEKYWLLSLVVAVVVACGPAGLVTSLQQQLTPEPVAFQGGTWSGTIKVSQTADSTETNHSGGNNETTRKTLRDLVTIEVVNGQASGRMSYSYTEHVTNHMDSDIAITDITMDTTVTGSGEDSRQTRVQVTLYPDGGYEIEYSVPSVEGTWQQDGQSDIKCKYGPPTCSPSSNKVHKAEKAPDLSGADDVIEGTIDPKNPTVLSGTQTNQFPFQGKAEGTMVVSWSLVRK